MKILIAEDDPVSQKFIEHLLRPFGKCTLANDGKIAIEAFYAAWAEKDPYQLVCLDIMMPHIDGHAVLEKIRRYEQENRISEGPQAAKVIITTALEDSENFIKALDHGTEWYITKPIDKAKLIGALRDLGLVA